MLNPTSPDLVRAVIANIDELVLPQLEGPHARSAAKNVKLLLTHVLYQLENEGPSLSADNAAKRALLRSLTEQIGDHAGVADVRSRLDATPAAGAYVTIEALAEEARALRQLMIDVSLVVHRSAATLGEVAVDQLLAPLRRQLREQLDRDTAAVAHITPAEVYDHKGM